MHGLQPITIRSYKRIRCPPTCPLGTRGTILSRRLAQERIRWYQVPGDPEKTAPTAARSTALPHRHITYRIFGNNITVQPNPQTAVPLNGQITKLTPISVGLREAPIRRLLQAIDKRQDVAIWHYFSSIADTNVIRRLSAADFSSILLSLRPRRYVSLEARHHLNDSNEAQLMTLGYSYEVFRQRLQVVTKGMQANGYPLGIHEYTHLLDCARAGGDTKMAEQLWNQMATQGVALNTWAYNSYMAAMCGTASTDRELRLTERNLSLRIQKGNVRDIALSVYKRMIEGGITPNSMTFDILLLAVARMGDLASTRRTLKEVWGVDITALSDPENSESMQPLMPPSSPLYPSPHTLASVAVAFGTNNNIETAIRAVDHLARRYKIPITIPTWTALLNWTYVLTRPQAILPKYSVINLWQIMTAAPYKIKPTLEMYDYLVRSLVARKMIPDAETMINRGLKVFARMIARASTASAALDATFSGFPNNNATYDTLMALRRSVALARRGEFRGRSTIRRWIELLCLGKGMWPEHSRIRVPNAVRKMRFFLGATLRYVTPTGYVELRLGRRSEWKPISVRRRKRAWTPLGTGAKEVDYLD